MKYHALFVIFEKAANRNGRLQHIIGGALRFNNWSPEHYLDKKLEGCSS